MEIDSIFYKAKDGRIFTDPLECEEYEKTIDIVKGSAADFIQYLESKISPKTYVHGVLYLKTPDGKKNILNCITACCDMQLGTFVNVDDLAPEQRYIFTTIEDVIRFLKKFDKDSPVQYMLTFSDNVDFEKPGVMAMCNNNVWDKKE